MLRYGPIRSILRFSRFNAIQHRSCSRIAIGDRTWALAAPRVQQPPQSHSLKARSYTTSVMPKRKSVAKASDESAFSIAPITLPNFYDDPAPPPKRRASQRKVSQPKPDTGSTNPDKNANVLDAPEALRASPDASEADERLNLAEAGMDVEKQVKAEDEDDSPLSDAPEVEPPPKTKKLKSNGKTQPAPKKSGKDATIPKARSTAAGKKETAKEPQFLDPEAEGDEEADEEEIQAALSRPPPVNSDYLPLPWKGRLGYVGFAPKRHRSDH